MCEDSLTHRLSMGITALERKHRKYMKRALADKGVTGVVYSYITTIKNNHGISQDWLSDFLGVDKSQVARKVRELEVAGYVFREVTPNNRRQYMLSLTESGEWLHGVITGIAMEWEALIGRDIDEGDISAAVKTVERIINNLESAT